MRRKWADIQKVTWDRASVLRHSLTPFEKILWKRLRGGQLGFKVRRQHPIGPYVVVFFVQDAQLVIEVDGDTHADEKQIEHDQRRTEYLRQKGIRVIRFGNRHIANDINSVIDNILMETGVALPEAPLSPPKTATQILGGDQKDDYE
ncbi:MAG: DUF559 domain-containing protein [Calditrichaeota bacterium]|nr:DUF559 domain-containing protein [Calditrichota bacterium]MCB9369557.1 DUF559 domain-containing protein [Calditrichota bacterium]